MKKIILLCLCLSLSAQADFKVVASIRPLHSVLAALMQGSEPPQLLWSGLPYEAELDEQARAQIQAADWLLWVGPELEPALATYLQRVNIEQTALLDREELKILPSRWSETERDPYFWLDSRNGLILIDLLTAELVQRNPGLAHLYRRNREQLFKKIAKLDRRFEYGYRGLQGGVLLAYYDTQQYFEQAYALKILDSLSPHPPIKPDAAKLLQARVDLSQGIYQCLLLEKGMETPELPLLVQGLKIEQAELDSFGLSLKPGPDLYPQILIHNTQAIKKCLHSESELLAPDDDNLLEPVGQTKFMLLDHRGQVFTDEDMRGHYALIYFGYTHCPDICPTSLQVMSLALKRLPPKLAQKIKAYFITVDPERDTQAILKDYVPYFHPDLIGLTGKPAMIQRLIRSYRIVVEKVPQNEGYLIDHSASLFLMAPDGRLIKKYAHGIRVDDLLQSLEQILDE